MRGIPAVASLWCLRLAVAGLLLPAASLPSWAEEPPSGESSAPDGEASPEILSDQQWDQLDETVDNGLKFLATQQEKDGSFPTLPHAKPGITSLCVLAFLSRGHLPNEGPYGKLVHRGIEFVLSTQRDDGLFTNHQVEPVLTSHGVSHVAMYNHGFAGLMLSEVYGVSGGEQSKSIRKAIVKGLEFSRTQQLKIKGRDEGGFDYLVNEIPAGPDLPITSGQLLFYRSAKNAEFEVPAKYMQDAMRYVKSCYDARSQTFRYRGFPTYSRGLTASGVLALSLGGEHNTDMAQEAGQWLLTQSFEPFNRSRNSHDRYFYSAYYCSQAMFQLGGEYWSEFYPPLLKTLAENQRADGSWDRERSALSARYGNSYSSALAILALTPPYQLLPIFQR